MIEKQINNETFRIAKMSAIETLALQSQIDFSTFDKSLHSYNTILEHIEVKVKDSYLPVKSGNCYLPAGIENDLKLTKELIKFMLNYLEEVFQKSSELKNEQE